MLRIRKILLIFASVVFIFLLLIIRFMFILTKSEDNPTTNINKIILEIHKEFNNLKPEFFERKLKDDAISNNFIYNLKSTGDSSLESIWKEANSWISRKQLYSAKNSNLGNVWKSLTTAKIVNADLDTRGTQLKFLLTLEGNQDVVFKPKWYEKDKIIDGPVYGGKDRYGSEIFAFFLSAILNKPYVPISAARTINIRKEILPVASTRLLTTVFNKNNRTCIYGSCYYCKIEDPICDDSNGLLAGAVIFNINKPFKMHRSPWQRIYKKNKFAVWETDENFCKVASKKISRSRLYDLIDAAVFDFFIQNGDRHHYETLEEKLILIDNGKGLGNPYVHHLDILAPLYQCCVIRDSTWRRLLELSGGLLKESLLKMPSIDTIVTHDHIDAVSQRLLYIFATVEYCRHKNNL